MLTVCLIISAGCLSQTTTEPTVSVPKSILEKTVKLLQVGEFNKEKAALLEEQTRLLKQQIAIKDSIIRAFFIKDTIGARIVDTYKAEIKNLQEQLQLATVEVKKQNKYYRRQKRKTVFIAIAGPAVTAAAILYIKK